MIYGYIWLILFEFNRVRTAFIEKVQNNRIKLNAIWELKMKQNKLKWEGFFQYTYIYIKRYIHVHIWFPWKLLSTKLNLQTSLFRMILPKAANVAWGTIILGSCAMHWKPCLCNLTHYQVKWSRRQFRLYWYVLKMIWSMIARVFWTKKNISTLESRITNHNLSDNIILKYLFKLTSQVAEYECIHCSPSRI